MDFRKEYVYVDFHSSAQRQWKRVRIDQVKSELGTSKNYKCFKSVQRYAKAHSEPDELFWMPLFFDFDAADPADCVEDVKKIVGYFKEILEVPKEYIHIFFSGKKGFHVIVEPEVFDIRPNRQLHLRVKKAAMYLADFLALKTFDPKVYSVRRVLRIPNSIHESTKLFKIELSLGEACKGMAWIQKQAKSPKSGSGDDEPHEEIPIVEPARDFWEEVTKECEETKELTNLAPSHKIKDFGDLPVCMKHLLSIKDLPTANTGNKTVVAMASYLKDAGRSVSEAIAMIVPWALKLGNIGWRDQPDKLAAALTSTIKYIYHKGPDDKKDAYQFACKYILALGAEGNKIPCQYVECPAIKGKLQETKETIRLQLGDFSKSCYLGEKVSLPTLISGKAGTPYVVPKRIAFTCEKDDDGKFCANCPIEQFDGAASFELDVRDHQILEIVNTTSKNQWEAIRRKFRFPGGCRKNRARVEDNMNVEEVRLSPAAMDIADFEKREYVNRKGFFIGYPIPSNKRYTLTGYPVKEPKTQTSAFIFQQHEKLETEVESFELTKEIRNELEIFKAKPGELEEKWREIHEDFATNVTRIWNRTEVAWAVDLVAHSVRGFKFRSEPFVKGWAELLIVGDSGQGKTSIVRRLVQSHYRIGEYISGGSARRTGLLYSYQENGKTWMLIWGALPLNDLGLVVIDEFGDLPEDQFAVMTDVRSSGIVKAVGVVTAETYARVRLIALSNAKGGKHLAEYDTPVSAIKELVPAAEDIRRFDLACAVSSGEVAVEVINREIIEKRDHIYTSHLCANLVRWVWSRKETQIEFTDEASKLVLNEATRMAKDFYAGAIPLVEPADQRFKIARLAVAAAARVFSCDDTGEKIVVGEEHVGFISALLYHIYTSSNFKYKEWSSLMRKTDVGGAVDLEGLFEKLKGLNNWIQLLGLMTLPGQIEAREVENIMGDKGQATSALQVLRVLGLVEKKWGKFHKTARGNQFTAWVIDSNRVSKADIERAMMSGFDPFTQPPPTC